MSEKKTTNNLKTNLLKGLLFVFFAIPGAFLCVFSGIAIIGSFSTPPEKMPARLSILIITYLVGGFFTLLGLGKIRQWLYGAVFLVMPISFWIFALIDTRGMFGMFPLIAVVGLSGYAAYRLVKRFYEKQNNF